MAPTTRNADAQAVATPTTSNPSSSSPPTSIPASTSNTATDSQEIPVAGNSNNPASRRSANSSSIPNPPTDDDVEIVNNSAEASESDIEMADDATVTENARDGEGIPVRSLSKGKVPDDVSGDTDHEENADEYCWRTWRETADWWADLLWNAPKTITIRHNGERKTVPFAPIRRPRTDYDRKVNKAFDDFMTNSECLFGYLSAELNARADLAESKAILAVVARARAIAPAPVAPRPIRPLPIRARNPFPAVHNPVPPQSVTVNPGAGSEILRRRALKPPKEPRLLKHTDQRNKFVESIGESRLRISVTADGVDGELTPIAYGANGELDYATVDEEESDERDKKGSLELVYRNDDMTPFMHVVVGMGSVSLNNDGDFEKTDEETTMEVDDEGFDGDCEDSGNKKLWKKGKGRALAKRNLKRRREDDDSDAEDSDEESEDEQKANKMRMRKKHRTLRHYEDSDEEPPVASAPKAEDNQNAINESEEPSTGSEDDDEEDDEQARNEEMQRIDAENAGLAWDPVFGYESQDV